MARGISIKDVENKVQHINDNNVIPLSTGADVPEVVTVGVLKEHINEDVNTALEGKQDVINDLDDIRSGAALGATAIQVESDPTVPSWAKAASKPSYTASEVGALPDTTSIPTESTVSGWGFTKNEGTVTSVTVNGSTYSPTNGDVDLGTIGGGSPVFTVYTAAWTASSSNNFTTRLTDILSLTEGLYIVRIQIPVTQNSMTVQLDGTNIVQRSNTYYNGPNYSQFMDFIEVSSGGGTLYVRSASNAEHAFSYLERGSLKALKLM